MQVTLNQLLIQDWNYYFSRDRRKIHFTKNTELHISCCAVSRHIHISPNKVVHCRAAVCIQPRILRSLKIFRDCRGKGNTRDRSVIGENSRFISAKTHFSIHRSGIARPTLIEFSLRYAYQREARMCVRGARALASASQCVHSRYHLTHARACSTRRSTTPAALSPQRPSGSHPFPVATGGPASFPPAHLSCPLAHRAATRGPHPYDLFYRRHVVPSLSFPSLSAPI